MRRKTYLTPEQQWERTLALYRQRVDEGERGIRERMNYALPRYLKAVAEALDWFLGDHIRLGRGVELWQIVQPDRYFLRGDLVLTWRPGNGECQREKVWAVSSKGFSIEGLYRKHRSWWWDSEGEPQSKAAGPLRFVEPPDDLVGLRPDDPAVGQFVAALRAGYAASRHE